jgi:hypothetical protein
MSVPRAIGAEMARWRRTPALFATVIALVVVVVAVLFRAALIAPLHVPLDPNEGWNAYHAAAAMAGNPYPPANSFLTNNYPPLSFYVVGLAGSWLGDNIVAGRCVSLAAFAAIGLFIALTVGRMSADWGAATFATLLFAAILLLTSDYVGMDDPQLLGHACQLAGLLFVIRAPRTTAATVLAAFFFVAGGFVKHNLFALPLATLAWLYVFDRQSSFRYVAGLLAFAAAGFFATNAVLHVNLLLQLNSARAFSFVQLKTNLLQWLPAAAMPLCAWLWLVFRFARHEEVVFAGLYAALSIATGVLLFGGVGVDVNAMFDADIALALSAGLAISRLLAEQRRMAAQVFCVLCVIPFAMIAWRTPDWRNTSFWFDPMRDETALAEDDVAFLERQAGPAMCENLTFCYWAGKSASVDVFNLDQQFETGARNPAPFLHLIRSRSFASVELDETTPFPLSESVEAVFLQNYRLHHHDDEGSFFVRR